ncbi:hypothetical protein EVG20_g7785 [Dentipellis fragilis]|uniref:Uncharacterized protein n=1 Tax=Dentipellis fragilis TaxID=205917 RepID=A0A4Y9YAC9_9AGAM|nr:hypothetical protein EVG20_g7785 [Dentipellis fragilis]
MAKSTSPQEATLNPRTTTYEFMGPPGAFAVTVGVPIAVYALYFSCNDASGGCPPPLNTIQASVTEALSDPEWWVQLWDTQAALMYLAWYTFCVVAWKLLPGDWVEGTQLRNGGHQKYKFNAFATCLLALGLTTGYIWRFGAESFTFLYERWVGFVTAALAMSIFQGVLWYALSFRSGKLLALGGNSGNFIYDVRAPLQLFRER